MFGKMSDGIFESSGAMEEINECQLVEMNAYGVSYQLRCEICGNNQRISIAWPQIIQVAQMPRTRAFPVDPETRQPWVLEGGRLYPNIGCIGVSCRKPIKLTFTPDEAARLVQQGVSAGFIQSR